MLNHKNKILIITSGQPSLNPRMVKEADALANAGYNVIVFYMYWNKWGAEFDKQLIASKQWQARCIGGDPEDKWLIYFFSKLIYKVAKIVNRKIKGRFMANLASSRASFFLIKAAKKQTADLYIGHNFGALPATVIAAKKNNKPCGFDAEDFHRNETSDDANNADVILKTRIENKYLPQLNYFTTSSPQIANAYKQLYPDLDPVVILNVFPKSVHVVKHSNTNEPLKLFWFSQTIGDNRGIKDIIEALQFLDLQSFELHLLGNRPSDSGAFMEKLNNSGIRLTIHNPIPSDKLIQFATQFDIGLALEPGFSVNNELALSNKIFTYMQAGLAIIASDTTAQQDFMNAQPAIGNIYPKGNSQALAAILLNFKNNREQLLACKTKSLQLAHQEYNWENESLKFLEIVKSTLLINNTDA